jgi:hypothetical protein
MHYNDNNAAIALRWNGHYATLNVLADWPSAASSAILAVLSFVFSARVAYIWLFSLPSCVRM